MTGERPIAPGGEAVERRFQALAETLGAKKAVMEGELSRITGRRGGR